jgi:hypothetical protein
LAEQIGRAARRRINSCAKHTAWAEMSSVYVATSSAAVSDKPARA